jgi:hypothetical protein
VDGYKDCRATVVMDKILVLKGKRVGYKYEIRQAQTSIEID